jgi:NAD-dependent DNA ligase
VGTQDLAVLRVVQVPQAHWSTTATSLRSARKLAYEIDGVVYKVNRLALQRGLASSRVRRVFDRAQVSCPENTIVRDVEFQVGRTAH